MAAGGMAFLKSFLTGTLLAVAGAGHAASPLESRFRLALNLNVFGIGQDVSFHPDRWLSQLYGRSFLANVANPRIDDQPRLKLKNYGLMGDIYTFGSGLRISAGVREDSNHMLLQVSPQPGMPADDVTTGRFAPVVAFGYGRTVARGLSFGGDIGLVLQGRQISPMSASGSTLMTPVDMVGEQSQGRRDIRRHPYAPMVQMSAGYRF
jgi:hypothetical protein